MNRLAAALLLVLLSFPAGAAPWTGATVEDLAAWMKAAGYDARIKSNGYKDETYIVSHVGDQEFELFLSDCRPDRHCGSMHFSSYLNAGLAKFRNVGARGRYRAIKVQHDDTGFYAEMQLSLANFPDDALATGFAAWCAELPELMKTMAASE
jgi:hypothetical protein